MRKRLSENTGSILHEKTSGQGSPEAPEQIEKQAILVHEGSFKSKDGPIAFNEARLRRVVANHNLKIKKLEADYGGEVPIGAYPPVNEEHSDGSVNVIGRLKGQIKFARMKVPKVGDNVGVILGTPVFIGKENTSRALDGRLFHGSIEIDERTDTLDGYGMVNEPAAPGARLLSKGPDNKGGRMKLEALKGMSTKLGALNDKAAGFKKKLVEEKNSSALAAAKQDTVKRLSKLVAGGKVSPAELKAMKVDSIARMSAPDKNTLFEALEARQPVVEPGQRGTTNATPIGEIALEKGEKMKKDLKAETRKELKRLGAKLKEDGEGSEDELDKKLKAKMSAEVKEDIHPEKNVEKVEMYKSCMAEMKKHLEAGSIDGAKQCMKKLEGMNEGDSMVKHMAAGDFSIESMGSDVTAEAYQKKFGEMQEQIDALQVMVAEVTDELSKIITAEEAEGHDDLAADPAQAKPASDPAAPVAEPKAEPAAPQPPAAPAPAAKKELEVDPQVKEDKQKDGVPAGKGGAAA